jgi:hypothetical protein
MEVNKMEYLHASYTKGPILEIQLVTLRDDVMQHKGMDVLVQTNEYDTRFRSRVRTVNVVQLLEPLYASSTEHSVGLTKARKIQDSGVRKELTDKIRESGVHEPLNF